MHKPSLLKKIAGLLSLASFLTAQFAPPFVDAAEPAAVNSEKPELTRSDLAQLALPEGVGRIEEKFEGSSEGTVVLLQDAHAIPEAQRNIRKLIEHFQSRYGVRLIGLEGGLERVGRAVFSELSGAGDFGEDL